MSDQDSTNFWVVVAGIALVIFLIASGNDAGGGSQYDRYDEPHSCYGDYRLGDC